MLQILINFLQVTGIAVFINVKWTRRVLSALGMAGKDSRFSLPSPRCKNTKTKETKHQKRKRVSLRYYVLSMHTYFRLTSIEM